MVSSRQDSSTAGDHERCLVIQPNASLTPRQGRLFFVSMCAVSFGIAMLFALQGFWVVLPFAGLEMAALGAGLYWSMRGNTYREVIRVEGDRVLFESGRAGPDERREYQRAWAQVVLEPRVVRNHAPRLLLRSHGRDCEFGRCLTAKEKREVAQRLKRWLNEPVSRAAPAT